MSAGGTPTSASAVSWPRPASLSARLTLLFALLTAGLLSVAGLVIGAAVARHFEELDRHELATKHALLAHVLTRADAAGAAGTMGTAADVLDVRLRRLDDALIGDTQSAVVLRDEHGGIRYARHPDVLAQAPALPAHRATETAAAPADGQHGDSHGVMALPRWAWEGREFLGSVSAAHVPGAGSGAPWRFAVALDVSHHAAFLAVVRARLALGVVLGSVLAAGLAWLVSYKGLMPLRRVADTARGLSAQRLGERFAAGAAPAEVRDAVDGFNAMLDRLESEFRRLADYSADIAHELRTPISNLMTHTTVALSRSRSTEEYRAVLASNLEEYEHIARTVGDMLFLAQADEGRLPRDSQPVCLADEARALAEFYEALAESQDVRIEVKEDGAEGADRAVAGDRLMLRRAMANLLSNAVRHARPGSTVTLRIDATAARSDAPAGLRFSIANQGDTIPATELARIFERFHRAGGEQRRLQGTGAGLGLAITRSIAAAHGGTVGARSQHGETVFELWLPGVPPAG